MPDTQSPVLAGVPDLFFQSKISATAHSLGVAVAYAGSQQVLLEKAAAGAGLLLLDLAAVTLDPLGTIESLRAAPATREIKIIAFANHEHTELMEAARRAGADRVLTRGAFSSGLPGILRGE